MSILVCLLRAQVVMGTILEIEAYGKDAEAFVDTIFSLANMMDSLWRGFWEGWVSRGETLYVDKLTDSLLILSMYYYKKTEGVFNPFYRGKGFPERFGKGIWYFPKGCSFDPGGIAKGFALDVFVSVSKGLKLDSFLINFGGSSIYGKGVWKIRLPNGELLTFKDIFVSSSSSLRDNKPHIYDPRKKRFIKDKRWEFVVTTSGVEGDVLSTLKVILR